jgi:drug/metabolite transporter (DMT)-like permease
MRADGCVSGSFAARARVAGDVPPRVVPSSLFPAAGHRVLPVSSLITRARDIDVRGAALTLLISVLWGANPVAIKLGLEDAPPLRLAWMRFFVGGLAVAAWAWATGRLAGLRVEREQWRPLLVLGLLFTAQIGTMNVAVALTTAAHATVILNMYAVHTVVLAHFMIPGDRLTLRRLIGALVAYGGIVALFARELSTGAPTWLGDLVMFGSALLLAERTVYLARAVHHFDPILLLLSQAAISLVLFGVASLLLEPAPTRWTLRLGASIAYQGLLIAGFNFAVNLWLLKRYRPSTLATFFLTQPIFGVAAAALFAGDALTPGLLLASLAVAVGIGLAAR